MINNDDTTPSFTPSSAPLNEQGSRLRRIMESVGASLGLIKLHEAPALDPNVIKKTKEIDEILFDLARVKKEFIYKLDPQLRKHVEAIINPMERQLKKLKTKLEEKGIDDAGEGWVLKAKAWTQLRGKPLHRAAIMARLISHIKDEVESSIKQDFHVIQVYLRHRMDSMKLSLEQRISVEEKLQKPLRKMRDEVTNLAILPAEATLEFLTTWRANIDSRRQKHQEDALELIDRHLPKKTS